MLDWHQLYNIGTSKAIDLLEGGVALEDDVYKISNTEYVLADDFSVDGERKIQPVSVFWACSEAAFRRAYFRDVENDDLAESVPPAELIPAGAKMNYDSIREALIALDPDHFSEYASYRVMSDGAFVHKSLESLRVAYYFRSPDIDDSELPYAILLKLLPLTSHH